MSEKNSMTFWQHLDELRAVIIRVIIVFAVCTVVAFFFKDDVFSVLLAPKSDSFITYHYLNLISSSLGYDSLPNFSVDLINTGLAAQFLMHMKAAMCVGLLCAFPYILYCLFHYISPALYDNEKKYASRIVVSAYFMFMVGAAVSYFIIFPLTFRFLGTYQVSPDVTNMINLESYMSTLIMMTLSMGIVFEMPVLAWLLGKAGVINADIMKTYRRHAIVVIVIIAAIITPTTDVFTLIAVSLPMNLLYEVSVLLLPKKNKKSLKTA